MWQTRSWYYSTHHRTDYFWECVLSCVIFHLKLLHLYDIQACKYQLKYCILFQFIHAIWFVWRDKDCWKCGIIWKWYIEHVECWGCADVRDVRYWICWMLGLWDIGGYGMFGMCECLRFGIIGMWDVWDVGCWGCRMLGMWDVWDVGYGIWDICWDVEYWFAEDLVVRNNSWSNSLSWKFLLIFLNVVPTLLLTASFNCLFDLLFV